MSVRSLQLLVGGALILSAAPAALSQVEGVDTFSARPALVLSGGVAAGFGDLTGFTAELNEPNHVGDPCEHSQWWKWTAPSSGVVEVDTIGSDYFTRMAVYTGTAVANLSLVAANSASAETPNEDSLVRFYAVSGVTYSIVVDGFYDYDTSSADEGETVLTLRFPAPDDPPANDNFIDAAVMASQPSVTASGDTTDASVEATEPDPEITAYPSGAGRSVWFQWVAPSAGFFTVTLDASASPWNPTLGIYTGSNLATLTSIYKGENLSFQPRNVDSTLMTATFNATAGTTYRIQVAAQSFDTTFGTFDLDIAPASRPANDDFANATSIGSAVTYGGQGTLLEGTRQSGEPNHFINAGVDQARSAASIWWKWVAPSATTVTVDTRGSDGDSVLVVYRGTALNALVAVSGNDDTNFGSMIYSSAVTFTAGAGQTYYFAVAGYSLLSEVRFHLATGARRLPYQAWLLDYPSLTGANAAKTADPDQDGFTNLTELMFDTDPTVNSYTNPADIPLLPTVSIEGTDMYLDVGYSSDNLNGLNDGAGAGGMPIIATAQTSSNLAAWIDESASDFTVLAETAYASLPLTPGADTNLRVQVSDPNP